MGRKIRASSAAVALVPIVVLLVSGVTSVKITDLKVPPVIKNGTNESVVLDCEYSLNSEEKDLLVRWYLNEKLIYQWIPPKEPQGTDFLAGKLNLSYRASDEELQMYRALQILQPTTHLSGNYRCHVVAIEDEDHRTASMIVFAPEKRLELSQSRQSASSVNVSCKAEGVYPEPHLQLFRTAHKKARVAVEGVNVHTYERNGAFDSQVSAVEENRDLQAETLFECLLTIPGTMYTVRRNKIYYPGFPDVLDYEPTSDALRLQPSLNVLLSVILASIFW